MRAAIAPDVLRQIYERLAGHYDWLHGLLTAGADQRGRVLAVQHAVRPGDKVLDAGAGTGSTALLAARAVGSAGHVTLLDFSPAMLAQAKGRAVRHGLAARMSFERGDILRLPYADASFDSVVSTYSLCPVFDPAHGARELYRVLRPGGRIGIAHSTTPRGRAMRWLADRVEDVAWRFPGISMGCRAVTVVPTLREAGARVVFERRLGVPLYPFLVAVLEKPVG